MVEEFKIELRIVAEDIEDAYKRAKLGKGEVFSITKW